MDTAALDSDHLGVDSDGARIVLASDDHRPLIVTCVCGKQAVRHELRRLQWGYLYNGKLMWSESFRCPICTALELC